MVIAKISNDVKKKRNNSNNHTLIVINVAPLTVLF